MHYLNSAVSIDWRVSLVPAAAVIPAPVAYTNIAAVKKLVVECRETVLPDWYLSLMGSVLCGV
jgi:hypothetical protein